MARQTAEINTGSMADISFLLLTFFLLTTTMDIDSGIARGLPPLPNPNDPIPEVKERNVFNVRINSYDALFVEGKVMDIRDLKEAAKEFLGNPLNEEGLPEKRQEEIEELGTVDVSKGIISLQNDRGTSYDAYIQVQDALTAAVNELREEMARAKFGAKFIDLNQNRQKAITKAIPMSISEAEPRDVGGTK